MFQSLQGIFLAVISALFISVASAIVSSLNEVDSITKTFFVLSGIAFFSAIVLAKQGINPFKEVRWLLTVRSLLTCNAYLAFYYAFTHLPIADACTIAATSPAFTVILGWVLLREKISARDLLGMVMVFIGICCIVKPAFIFGSMGHTYGANKGFYFAAMIMVIGSILQATMFVTLKMLKDLHLSEILFNLGLVSCLECGIILLVTKGEIKLPIEQGDRLLLLLTSVLSFTAQVLVTMSLYFESAAIVCMFRKSCEVLFAFCIQVVVFRENPKMLSYVGAGLISLVLIMTGVGNVNKDNTGPSENLKSSTNNVQERKVLLDSSNEDSDGMA